jgi:hypothetical protein
MARFLNSFSKEAKNYKPDTIEYLKRLFESFLQSCQLLDQNAFQSSTKRFSITLYESVFVAVCAEPYAQRQLVSGKITPTSLAALKSDQEFQDAAESRTTSQRNVKTRLRRACDLIDVVN